MPDERCRTDIYPHCPHAEHGGPLGQGVLHCADCDAVGAAVLSFFEGLFRLHDRDRKARAWAAYVESNRRSRLRSQAWLGRALPDVRRG